MEFREAENPLTRLLILGILMTMLWLWAINQAVLSPLRAVFGTQLPHGMELRSPSASTEGANQGDETCLEIAGT